MLLSFHCLAATECSMNSYKFVDLLNNARIGGSKNINSYDDYDDTVRMQKEVFVLLNTKHLPIRQSTVNDPLTIRRSTTNEDTKLNVLFSMEENPHT